MVARIASVNAIAASVAIRMMRSVLLICFLRVSVRLLEAARKERQSFEAVALAQPSNRRSSRFSPSPACRAYEHASTHSDLLALASAGCMFG
jgi:hypothetical protein